MKKKFKARFRNCTEDFDAMQDTISGKYCAKCTKNVIDYRNKTWDEIIELQIASNYTECGIYTPKQVSDIPTVFTETINNSWNKAAKIASGAGLLISLLSTNTNAQTVELTNKVTDEETVNSNKVNERNFPSKSEKVILPEVTIIDYQIPLVEGITVPYNTYLAVKILNKNLPENTEVKIRLHKNGEIYDILYFEKSVNKYTLNTPKLNGFRKKVIVISAEGFKEKEITLDDFDYKRRNEPLVVVLEKNTP